MGELAVSRAFGDAEFKKGISEILGEENLGKGEENPDQVGDACWLRGGLRGRRARRRAMGRWTAGAAARLRKGATARLVLRRGGCDAGAAATPRHAHTRARRALPPPPLFFSKRTR